MFDFADEYAGSDRQSNSCNRSDVNAFAVVLVVFIALAMNTVGDAIAIVLAASAIAIGHKLEHELVGKRTRQQ